MTDTTDHTRPTGTRDQLRRTGSLLTDAAGQVSGLVRGEVDLLRAEVDQNVKKAGVAMGLIVSGVVVMLVALNVLAAALVAALTELGIDAGWAALIVGGAFAVIAAIMAMKGVNDLKLTSLAPTRTVKNVRRDGEAVREAL